MKLNTVNVVEAIGYDQLYISAFPDDEQGNRDAEQCFADKMKENNPGSHKHLGKALENGFWTDCHGYTISLVHST